MYEEANYFSMFGKSSNRYKKYREAEKYYQNITGQVDVISLGSSMAHYDYDFKYWGKIGINLASSPQTLLYDYRLLKQYEFTIQKGTIVLINIAEFTFLVDKYENDVNNHKYYFYLSKEYIENFKEYKRVLLKYFPCLIDTTLLKNELTQIVRTIIKKRDKDFFERCLEIESGWEKEFNIQNNTLSISFAEVEEANLNIVIDMISYIKEKEAIPIIVVPPVAPSLFKMIPKEILENCLYKYLEDLTKLVNVIDLSTREEIFPDNVFETPLILNSQGKKTFNEEIIKKVDIKSGV